MANDIFTYFAGVFEFSNMEVFLQFYRDLLRSHVEYYAVLVFSIRKGCTGIGDSITSLIPGMSGLPYHVPKKNHIYILCHLEG